MYDTEKFTNFALKFNAELYNKKLSREGINDSALIRILDYAVNPQNESTFKYVLQSGTELYRARIVKSDEFRSELGFQIDENGNIHGFNKNNSAEAPLGKPDVGRNNIKGTSYLYLADTIQTACAEVRPNKNEVISVAVFVPRRDLHLINFSDDVTIPREFSNELQISLPAFFTKLMNEYRKPVSDGKDYFLTQTVTDYVRKTGCDGIKYRSSLTDEPCYTIFNSHHSIIEFKDSTLFLPVAMITRYGEINTGKISTAKTEYPEEILNGILINTRDEIKRLLKTKQE